MGKHREARGSTEESTPAEASEAVNAGRSRRGSRVAFAFALTALMLGTFVSFGGLSYAATQTKNAAHTIKKVASGQTVVVHNSAAVAQYGSNKPTHKQVFTPPSGPVAGSTEPSTGTLPFTGLSLAGTALVSGLLLLVGIALRRRERRAS